MIDYSDKRAYKKYLDDLTTRENPPDDFKTWLDYALSHQHVGTLCWQCVAGNRAREERQALLDKIEDLELKLSTIEDN